METKQNLLARLACTGALLLGGLLPLQAADNPCLECHADIAKKVMAHKDCTGCHTKVDARVVPHSANGQSARENVGDGPGMCLACHDQKLFQGRLVHAPVEAGKCLVCHEPHASEHMSLLKMDPATLCLDCHSEIKKGPHVIAGFSRSGHPLGNDKKVAEDPLRSGKKFYCGACHEAHRSERPKLNRFGPGMASCVQCHKM